ncbi:MAG: hypothetical protein ACTJGH_00345 [Peptoniphilaceae bacterium]
MKKLIEIKKINAKEVEELMKDEKECHNLYYDDRGEYRKLINQEIAFKNGKYYRGFDEIEFFHFIEVKQ